jgi:hypothetical protein
MSIFAFTGFARLRRIWTLVAKLFLAPLQLTPIRKTLHSTTQQLVAPPTNSRPAILGSDALLDYRLSAAPPHSSPSLLLFFLIF